MPRNPYPGKKLHESNNYFETKITFEKIVYNPKLNNIIKPDYQGALNEDKVNSMIKEYIDKPNFFYFKNRIIIGDLNDTNNELIFCWYSFSSENDMRELFTSINKDSTKNRFYINCETFEKIKISEFMKYVNIHWKEYFAKKKSINGKKKTQEEFRDELISINYFKNNKSVQELYKNIHEKNSEFYELNRYDINIKHNKDIFYKEEINSINDKVIICLKRNNFIKWLNDKNEIPFHDYKKEKNKIPSRLKKACWEKEYGEVTNVKCPISFCNNIINCLTANGFQAGHIISEYNNGKIEINNLKPICKNCNSSMGSKNWIDYDPNSLNSYG
jgi:hypothetical protein